MDPSLDRRAEPCSHGGGMREIGQVSPFALAPQHGRTRCHDVAPPPSPWLNTLPFQQNSARLMGRKKTRKEKKKGECCSTRRGEGVVGSGGRTLPEERSGRVQLRASCNRSRGWRSMVAEMEGPGQAWRRVGAKQRVGARGAFGLGARGPATPAPTTARHDSPDIAKWKSRTSRRGAERGGHHACRLTRESRSARAGQSRPPTQVLLVADDAAPPRGHGSRGRPRRARLRGPGAVLGKTCIGGPSPIGAKSRVRNVSGTTVWRHSVRYGNTPPGEEMGRKRKKQDSDEKEDETDCPCTDIARSHMPV
ncbi:hypothetical protein CDD83_11175 [Cordyceps sp. RAO-2017]|nr:hypothetical protein CDD83_11175 [Cordyceps sp. RAO-2017]